MSRSSIGLDVGTRAVRVAVVRYNGGTPSLFRFGEMPLHEGAVERGEIHDIQAVASAISSLWKELKLSGRSVHAGLANGRVVVRIIDLPAMAAEDLGEAIRFQAQDHIPIPLDEAVVDYQVIDEIEGPEGQPLQRVLVVAAELATIDTLLEAIHEAHLEVRTLELNAYPLVRCYANGAKGAEAIVDVGAGVTTIVVHQHGTIRFTRILANFGGDEFTNAIAQGLSVPTKVAEHLKRKASELHSKRGKGKGRSPAQNVLEAAELLSPLVDRFVGEVRGSLDFYRSQREAAGLDRVILTGGGSLLGGLATQLEAALGVKVVRGDPSGHVQDRRKPNGTDAEPSLAVALGLALAEGGA